MNRVTVWFRLALAALLDVGQRLIQTGQRAFAADPGGLGGESDPSAKANYAFLDGSVRTMSFAEVYEDVEHNLFHPGVGDP